MKNGISRLRQPGICRALLTVLVALTMPLTHAAAQNGQTVGGGLGGLIGGGLGQVLGPKGKKTIATLIGAGVGALVGSRIGKGLSKQDQAQVANSTRDTFSTGQSRSWTGSRQGLSGRTELTRTDRRSAAVAVPVLKDRVTQLPPLDFINANFEAAKKDDVRGGPGTDYKQVAQLKKGEVVSVTGKVQQQPWYLISQNGVGVGFVQETSLRPTDAQPVQIAALAGTVETKSTEMARTCRTVKQTVVQNGKEQSEDVTACQTANGWEVI